MSDTYRCKVCFEDFNDKSDYDHHIQSTHHMANAQPNSIVNDGMEHSGTQVHEESSRNNDSNMVGAKNGTGSLDGNDSTWEPSMPNRKPIKWTMDDIDSSSSEDDFFYYTSAVNTSQPERRGPGRPRGTGRGRGRGRPRGSGRGPSREPSIDSEPSAVPSMNTSTTPSEQQTHQPHPVPHPVPFKYFSGGVLSPSDSGNSYDSADSEPSALSPPPTQRRRPNNTLPTDKSMDGFQMTDRKPPLLTAGANSQASETSFLFHDSSDEDNNSPIYYYKTPTNRKNTGAASRSTPPTKPPNNTGLASSSIPPTNRSNTSVASSSTSTLTKDEYTWKKLQKQRQQQYGTHMDDGKNQQIYRPKGKEIKVESVGSVVGQLPRLKRNRQPKRKPGEIVWRDNLSNTFKAPRLQRGVGYVSGLERRMGEFLADSWIYLLQSENLLGEDVEEMSQEHENWIRDFTKRYAATLPRIQSNSQLFARAMRGTRKFENDLKKAEREAGDQVIEVLETLAELRGWDDTVAQSNGTEQLSTDDIPGYPSYYDYTSLGTLIGPAQPFLQNGQIKNKKASTEEIDRYALQLRHLNISDIGKGHSINSEGYFLPGNN